MAKKSKSVPETLEEAAKTPASKACFNTVSATETTQAANDILQNNIANMLFGHSSTASTIASAHYMPHATGYGSVCGPSYPASREYDNVIMRNLNIDGLNVGMMLHAIYDIVAAKNPINIESNLDVIQHYSAEQLAKFIAYEAKKIISGSGDAVAELTEWLKAKPE